VLVVDDNVDSAETTAALLRLRGHDVRTAHDGPTAVAVALDYQPNVALLDIGLPGMDGYELARRLQEDHALRGIVLIAMTGYAQDEHRRRAQQAGFTEHLVKPVPLDVLDKVVTKLPPAPKIVS
jgi:CheY-like chemotaxis protein